MLEKAAIPQFLDIIDEAEKIAKICQPKSSITEADIKQSIEEGQKAIEKKIRKAAKRLQKGHKKAAKIPKSESHLAEESPVPFNFSPAQQSANPSEAKKETVPPSFVKKSQDKGLPSLFQCGESLKAKVGIVRYQNNLYYFNGLCYDILTSKIVVKLYQNKVDPTISGERSLRSILQLYDFLCLDESLPTLEYRDNLRIAVLQNGVYHVESGVLKDHSPKRLTFSYLNANYTDSGKCKHFRRFLDDVTRGDKTLQERIWQSLGYILMQTTEGKFFFLMGEARDSGKSLLGNFIQSLYPEEYVSNITLNELNKDFSLAPLVGKAVNISLDLPATKLNGSAVSLLKMATGGDTLLINEKYVPKFNYRNRAKFIFATNYPVSLGEDDDAFWARMVYLPFDFTVPKAKQNPNLPELLNEERDEIVSEALRHAKVLVKNNFRFPTTELIENRMQEWRGKRSSSIEGFVAEQCVLSDDSPGELVSRLYEAYQNYCFDVGATAASYIAFKNFLEHEMGLHHAKIRDGGNPQSAFRGIQLMNRR